MSGLNLLGLGLVALALEDVADSIREEPKGHLCLCSCGCMCNAPNVHRTFCDWCLEDNCSEGRARKQRRLSALLERPRVTVTSRYEVRPVVKYEVVRVVEEVRTYRTVEEPRTVSVAGGRGVTESEYDYFKRTGRWPGRSWDR